MNNNSRNRATRKRAGARRRIQNNSRRPNMTTLPKTTTLIPFQARVAFKYIDGAMDRLSSGSNSFASFQSRLNSLYDPDPLSGGGSVTGFNLWSGFYYHYRVESVLITWHVVNKDTFQKSVFIYLGGMDASPPSSYAQAQALAEQPMSTEVKTLGPLNSGTNTAKFRRYVSLSSFYGGADFFRNPIFVGQAGNAPGNPTQTLMATFVSYSDQTLTSGVYSSLSIKMYSKLFERYIQAV